MDNGRCAEDKNYIRDGYGVIATQNVTLLDCLEDTDASIPFGGIVYNAATRYSTLAIMLSFTVPTVMGNAAIIACVVTSHILRSTNYSVYVVSLAVSDLIIGAICIPAMAFYTAYGYWPLGSITCIVYRILDFVCCAASNIHLNVIAYDRFRAVAEPLEYRAKFTKARARKLAVAGWMLAVLYYFPGIALVGIIDHIHGTTVPYHCPTPIKQYHIFGTVVIGSYGPALCLVVLFVFLMRTLRRRHKVYKTTQQHREPAQKKAINVTNQTLADGVDGGKISGQNRRCLLTLLVQVILFLICWVPFMVTFPVGYLCESCVPAVVKDIVYWMAYLNSTVNPILYLVFNLDYRNAFMSLFSCQKKA